jgi:hypothetical protein
MGTQDVGSIKVNILGTVEVKGKQYGIVESAEGGYVNGIYTKYLLAPLATIEKTIPPEQRADRQEV